MQEEINIEEDEEDDLDLPNPYLFMNNNSKN